MVLSETFLVLQQTNFDFLEKKMPFVRRVVAEVEELTPRAIRFALKCRVCCSGKEQFVRHEKDVLTKVDQGVYLDPSTTAKWEEEAICQVWAGRWGVSVAQWNFARGWLWSASLVQIWRRWSMTVRLSLGVPCVAFL